jgi:hypothetical protein
MLAAPMQQILHKYCCCCVRDDPNKIDDGSFVTSPLRIGSYILFYGRRKSTFPFQCFVGPDWPFVILVLSLIIAINVGILYAISPLGWPPVLIGGLGGFLLLSSYCSVAFSDPGIIYRNDYTSVITENTLMMNDVENGPGTTTASKRVTFSVQQTIECGNCQYHRPTTASHCHYCDICVNKLDHHCPW